MNQTNNVLSEQYVQDSFHRYLKSSLTQAKVEKLLDVGILSSAESDLMITGPSLCLYFAALRCTTNPPSVPLPRLTTAKSSSSPPVDLSFENCPPPFIGILHVWAHTVPTIQNLVPEHQHDLARVICGLDPLSSPIQPAIRGIAADLRAVAIEISQRRSFQDKFAADLQAALDSGTEAGAEKASFVPPPVYDPLPSPLTPTALSLPPSTSTSPPPPPPPLLSATSPPIDLIRETLYASLASVLSTHPSLLTLLSHDAPRAYFSSVSLSILHVSTTLITPSGSIISVLGTPITLDACPEDLRAFMRELVEIGKQASEMMEEDTMSAVEYVQKGEEVPVPRMERVRAILEGGVGGRYMKRTREGRSEERRRSIGGRVVAFANRINALSLGMTRLRAFRERQDEVFKVLAAVRS
ncbi:hypothetical protein C0989_003268 [Termitomyces sp. Mn162]|nr:hypothetical protein C0989_003268 [Termitomyces sp. Mn162]